MREIKFRGLRTDGKVWIYGDLIHSYWSEGNTFMPTSIRYLIDGIYSYPIEVIHETVGQFTGLTDKNGVEIFEGDKVKTTYGKWFHNKDGLTRNGIVVFDKKTASFKISVENSAVLVGFYDINKIEVIGNIHEVSL